MSISKELLNEVLEIEIVDYAINENQVRINLLWHEDNPLNRELKLFNTAYGCKVSINIYELAHKCKEWATENKYTILTEDMHPNGYFAYVLSNKESIENYGYLKAIKDIPHNKTEPEAIFKATSYIMEQLKQKD